MRALRFYAPGDLRLEEVPQPKPRDGEVLLRVEVALTDGTDFKAYRRGHPRLLADVPSPFGHELCGIDVERGQRVVPANSAPCGECGPCRRGQQTQCENLVLVNGAYAEYLLVPARVARSNVLAVGDRLAPEIAALAEPLACCLRGVEAAELAEGETAAILGAGPIGLMLAACAADAGARAVVVGGRDERRRLVPSFGGESGDGSGADVVIEAAGTEASWRDALALARRGGRVVFFGGREEGATLEVDAYRLHYEELTLRGAFHHTPRHFRGALAFLASGAYPWERLITHEVSLEGLPALFADPPRDLLKAAVRP